MREYKTSTVSSVSERYPTAMITDIEYSMLTQSNIEAIKTVTITREKFQNSNEREDGTLLDRRFGAQENEMCMVCNQVQTACIGHFGVIMSNVPYVIPSTSKILFSILNLFCQNCGYIKNKDLYKLTDDDIKKLDGMTLVERKSILKLNNIKSSCYNCHNKEYHKYKLLDGYIVVDKQSKSGTMEYISNHKLFAFVEKISTRMVNMLGISHKMTDFFYYKYVPVPPINIRPNKANIADDLTVALRAFSNYNDSVKGRVDPKELVEYTARSQMLLCTYDNSEHYAVTKNKTPYKSLITSQKGKDNRARANLQARRTDYNGRTVIGPSPVMYGYLKIPQFLVDDALHNTRVYVNNSNMEILQKHIDEENPDYTSYWDSERKEHIFFTRNTTRTGETKRAIILKPGDHIERKLRSNDLVLFMRQPSLHCENMVAMKVIVDPNARNTNTFQFHPDTVKPFNADFDGDEMNVFTAPESRATIEQRFLMTFEHNYISSADSLNNYGSLHSSIVGCGMATSNLNIPQSTLMLCYMRVRHLALKPMPDRKINIFDLLSLFIPVELSSSRGGIHIVRGEIVSKTPWNKKNIGVKEPDCIAKIVYDLTNDARLVMNISFAYTTIFDTYNVINGFTTSMRDFYLADDEYNKIMMKKHDHYQHILDTITEFEYKIASNETNSHPLNKTYTTFPKMYNIRIPFGFLNNSTQFETIQNELTNMETTTLDSIYKAIEDHAEKNQRQNNILLGINAKIKMTKSDIGKLVGVVGQQDIAGKIIQRSLNNRTYPYYPRGTNDPRAFGYVLRSLHEGLQIDEMNNLGSSCRREVVDVTCRTSETGYRARQLIKHLEDCHVDDLRFLVDPTMIIQFCFNGIKLDHRNVKYIPFLAPSSIITKKDKFDKENQEVESLYAILVRSMIMPDRLGVIKTLRFPVDPRLIIETYPEDDEYVTSFTQHYELIRWIELYIFYKMTESNMYSIRYIILLYFHPQALGKRNKYLKLIFDKVKTMYKYGCNPGLPAGIISAEEMQEMYTQSSLSSFHVTDAFMTNKNGFDRYKQITQLNKNAHKKKNKDGFSVSLTCEEVHNGKERLQEILNKMKYFSFKLLDPIIVITKHKQKNTLTLATITVQSYMLSLFNVTPMELYNILEFWLSTVSYINRSQLKLETTDTELRFLVYCNFSEPIIISINQFIDGIMTDVVKGKEMSRFSKIEYLDNYYNLDGMKSPAYNLNIIIDSTEILSQFDTINIDIKFSSPWIVYLHYNIVSCSHSIMTGIADSLDKKEMTLPHSHIIASKMCTYVDPIAIDRFVLPNATTLRDFAFETGQLIIPNAATTNKCDKVIDNASRIMTGQTIRVGTGFPKLEVDVDMLMKYRVHDKSESTASNTNDIKAFKETIY